jgi:hypothetical protein
VRCAATLLGVLAALLAGCGSASPVTHPATSSQQEEDDRDSTAVQRQVNEQVDEHAQTALTEAETAAGSAHIGGVHSNTVCIKQSSTTYKCVTSFESPARTPSVITNVTCGRDGGPCITETR